MIDSLYALLNRLGFTDPLHAMFAHIPIGLVIGAFLFLLVAIVFGRSKLVLTARHVSILAFIFVFPTILFGVFDWLHFFKGGLLPAIKVKMVLASVVLVVLAVGIILGSELKVRTAPIMVILAIAFISVIGLGYFGARLVFAEWGPGQTTRKPGGATLTAAAQSGQGIYGENCSACHPQGGNVGVAELPLKTSKKISTQSALSAFIRAPKMPDGSEGSMPAFPEEKLSDAQAADLFAYISAMLPSWK